MNMTRNYAQEIETDVRAGDMPALATAMRNLDQLNELRALNAELLEELQNVAAFMDSAIQQDILNGVECFPMMECIRAVLTKATA